MVPECTCTRTQPRKTPSPISKGMQIYCLHTHRTLPAMETFLPFLVRALVLVFCPCIGRP